MSALGPHVAGGDYAAIYDPDEDFDRVYTEATVERVAEWVRPGDRVLELGCATGLMTRRLLEAGASVVALERSPEYLGRAVRRCGDGASLVRADVDDRPWPTEAGGPFDHVLVCNLLHELADPEATLREVGDRLGPGGRVHLTLQNPRSIHRLAALEMGMIDEIGEISERGRRYGTRALWSGEELVALVHRAGLCVGSREGVMLKPLPNGLMEQLPAETIEGLKRAAAHLPSHCAMTYLVARRG